MKMGIQEQITKLLDKRHNACYVLITCEEPSQDGKMQVEMCYKGDDGLAAYLVDNAQDFFHQQMDTANDF
jgi:hypothetical protein